MKKTLGVTNILTTRQHEKGLSNQKVCLVFDMSFLKFNEDAFFVFKNTTKIIINKNVSFCLNCGIFFYSMFCGYP